MAKDPKEFDDYKELADYSLDPEDEQWLLDNQKECTFIWTNKNGEPVGLIMTFLAAKGKIWLLTTEKRVRVPAVRRDPRTCIVFSSAGLPGGTGKTVTYKGTTKVHPYDSPLVKDWLYQDYVARLHKEGNQERIDFFKSVLAIPERVVLEFTPGKKITFNGDKMAALTPGSTGKFDDMWK
ncbi:MAG: hypothetical protein OER85_02935 [Gammaproteobacteria bacterium]|nr:hypothetical protein [Gammaproteobacteria bacterium]